MAELSFEYTKDKELISTSKYIDFFEVFPNINPTKNRCFVLYNKKEVLVGWINYYPPWSKWVYTAANGIIIDSICLQDILEFISKCPSKT